MRNVSISCLAGAALLSLAACSSDAALYTGQQPDTVQQPATPGASDSPASPSVLGSGGDPATDPASEALGESPQPVLPSPGQEPEPNATETNFFTAGCRVDEDCGATRRCEFPPAVGGARDAGLSDAGLADGGLFDTRPIADPTAPARDAGSPLGADAAAADAGLPDAAPAEPLSPRGRCVDRVASSP